MDRRMPYPCFPRKLHSLRKYNSTITTDLTFQFTMTTPSQRELNNLALVAELMNQFVREDNVALRNEIDYRIQETDYFFQRMVSAYQSLEEYRRRWETAQRTMARLRRERDTFATRADMLEQWLLNYLESTEDFDSLVQTRPNPPLTEDLS